MNEKPIWSSSLPSLYGYSICSSMACVKKIMTMLRKVKNNGVDERELEVRLKEEPIAHLFSPGISHTPQEVFINRKLVDSVSTLGPYQIAACYEYGGLIAGLLNLSPEL